MTPDCIADHLRLAIQSIETNRADDARNRIVYLARALAPAAEFSPSQSVVRLVQVGPHFFLNLAELHSFQVFKDYGRLRVGQYALDLTVPEAAALAAFLSACDGSEDSAGIATTELAVAAPPTP